TVSAGLATGALVLFESWLITPNYNSLNFQALLITAVGVVLADKSAHRSSIIGWMLIGTGGWLTFMAKPSTALATGIALIFYLFFADKFSFRKFVITLFYVVALLLLSALIFDGSVPAFIKRFQLGFEFSMLQGGGYKPSEMLRINGFVFNDRLMIAFSLIFFAVSFAFYSSWKGKSVVSLIISGIFFLITALITLGQVDWNAGLGQFQGLLIFALIGSMYFSALVLGGLQVQKNISKQRWAMAAFFLILPHIYAFGTNGNYWHHGSWVGIFWLLAGLTVLSPMISERSFGRLLLPLAVIVPGITSILLQTGFERPYRQPQPLRLNSTALEIGSEKASLVLSQGFADYIVKAVSVAREAGFEAKTPVIDLTGRSPGIVFALGAESVGQAWIIGGYPGSISFAEAALVNAPCDRVASAWVLVEPNGPRSIPVEVLLSVGVDFFSEYIKIGMWQIAEGAGGSKIRQSQEMYKPKESQEILAVCQKTRKKVTVG
ncbi:MAG: YfhO family protein, partial [Sphingomonadales bacterium]|nr:YfhO family protein [Sphingomonadales bacterium]